MAPRSRSPSEAQRAGAPASLAPEDRDLVRAGLEAAERGEGHDLTEKEAAHYYETGELPERVQRVGELWAERCRASHE